MRHLIAIISLVCGGYGVHRIEASRLDDERAPEPVCVERDCGVPGDRCPPAAPGYGRREFCARIEFSEPCDSRERCHPRDRRGDDDHGHGRGHGPGRWCR
jgi:hypothetical protein